MTKELEGLEEGPKAEINVDLLKTTLKKYQIGKRQAMMEYMDSGSRNLLPFTTDKHEKWTDGYKEHTYPNRWPKERPYWSKRSPSKEPP